MSLLGRLSRPEEIASAIAFLLAPDVGTITGQILHVNGGVVFG
jgi:3-oxoacyl-[acyl-carrier protein] reductase